MVNKTHPKRGKNLKRIEEQKRLTLNGLWQTLENLQRTANDARPAIAEGLGHSRRRHLHECAERQHAELLVVHPRQAGVVINGDKPPVEERPRRAGLGHLHQMKSGGGVIQNRIDEDFQIGEFE